MSQSEPVAPIVSPSSEPGAARDALRTRIEAAERRIAERTLAVQAREAAEAAAGYARAHPVTVTLGVLVLGFVIGALTRPGRRFGQQVARGAAAGTSKAVTAVGGAAAAAASGLGSGVRRAATKPAARLGTALLDWAIAYAAALVEDALASARSGQDRIEEAGDAAISRARRLQRDGARLAAHTADASRSLIRRTRRKTSEALHDLKAR